ncbi:MAG: hypothetical protein IPG89_07405 [Bacteroidetes bacterium]|nr:hypothetical protein [Bacteroidota bacterium]
MSFRARIANSGAWGAPAGTIGSITVGGSTAVLASASLSTTALPPAVTQLGNAINITGDNTWHYYTQTFTYANANSLSNFVVFNSSNMNTLTNLPTVYIFIDDVSLVPSNQAMALTLPTTLCLNQTIPDLSSYLTPAAANGVFTGNGVQLAGGIYSFNSAIAGAGNHQITTFTNNVGCTISVSDVITVSNGNLNINVGHHQLMFAHLI